MTAFSELRREPRRPLDEALCAGERHLVPTGSKVDILARGRQHKSRVLCSTTIPVFDGATHVRTLVYFWADHSELYQPPTEAELDKWAGESELRANTQ